jgi:hypothetical protein
MKVVINNDFGGFGLSDAAVERYAVLKGINLVKNSEQSSWGGVWYIDGINDDDHYFSSYDIAENRADPILIQVVEEMGVEAASGSYASLGIVEIPDGVKWHIVEYDGNEHIAEEHRTWR